MATRKLVVQVVGDSTSVERAFLRSGKAASSFGVQVTNTSKALRNAFVGAGLAVGISAGVDQLKKAVGAASDLQEQVNKTGVVFGQSGADIKTWSETTATAFGLSQRAALEAAGGFGQILQVGGVLQADAAKMSKRLVELAADIASFNNIDPGDALDKLRSGLAGEAEPLRKVGVLLSEARVKQEAYASGIAKAGAELTEGQKVQARYLLVLKDTASAQGDFGRTSEGLANQQRILAAQVENLRSKIGEALLPAITDAVQGINQWLASSENQRKVQEIVSRTMKAAGDTAKAFKSIIQGIAPVVEALVSSLGGLERTVRLLAEAFIAVKIAKFTGLMDALTISTDKALTKTELLRGSLRKLGAIGVILISIEIIPHLKENKDVQDFFKSLDNKLAAVGSSLKEGGGQLGPAGAFLEAIANLDKAQRETNLKGIADKMVKIQTEGIKAAGAVERVRTALAPKEPQGASPGVLGTAAQGLGAGIQTFIDAINKVVSVTDGWIKKTDAQVKQLKVLQDASDQAGLSVDRFGLALQNASGTATLRDDIAAYQKISAALAVQETAIRTQLALQKNNVGLQKELVSIQGQQISNELALAAAVKERAKNQKEAALKAVQEAQFKSLGLDKLGNKPVPGVDNLKKRLGSIGDAVKGTFLDTTKTQGVLSRIRTLLAGGLGKLSADVREKVRDMLDDINKQLSGRKHALTKTTSLNANAVLAGLGLDPDQARQVRDRLSRFNSSGVANAAVPTGPTGSFVGGRPIVVENHNTITLDGKTVASSVTRSQQKTRSGNPLQRRGPNRGG